MSAMADLSCAALTLAYRRGELSPVEVARDVMARIERHAEFNAFLAVDAAAVLASARQSEARWQAAAPLGAVDGVPATVKDNIWAKGLPTRRGSKTTDKTSDARPAPADSPAVARLREQGAVVEEADPPLERALDLIRAMLRFHARYDLLLTPSMPVTALKVGREMPETGDFGDDWLNWSPYTYPFNLTQQPAASVPCGLARNGLPMGVQIVGPLRADAMVLRAARAIEQALPMPRVPALGRGLTL
jgi:Asp-tRNA(Asn)/Glu-tRNA(Gln) amidotransferase A subunit family amidase